MSIETILREHRYDDEYPDTCMCETTAPADAPEGHYAAHLLDLIRAELGGDEAVEAVARAMALVDDDDGCFERVAEWEANKDWQESYPEDYPGDDYEDCEWWRKRAREGIDALIGTVLGGE